MKKLFRRAAAQKMLGLKMRVTLVIDTIRWEGPLLWALNRGAYPLYAPSKPRNPRKGPKVRTQETGRGPYQGPRWGT